MSEYRGMYDDFAGYRVPPDDEIATALRTATVVVDTNVLFSLYRYSNATREALFELLGSLGDRLFVPHQVMREFWRNRLAVVADRGRGHDELLEQVSKNLNATVKAVETWARAVSITETDKDELVDRIEGLRTELRQAAQRQAPLPVAVEGGAERDPVLRRLEQLLAGRVGAALPAGEWAAAVEEGTARVGRLIPPGYMDADKAESSRPEGATGDYLVWSQAVAETRTRDGDLLLVTGDQKEDWWLRHRSSFIGPRPELVEELREACGAQLYMLRPVDLLRHAGALDVPVRAESVVEAERQQSRSPWTADGVALLLSRLEANGWTSQAMAIRLAAEHGGQVLPDELGAAVGPSLGRPLRGFASPTRSVTSQLQDDGLVADDVTPILQTMYRSNGETLGFRVPDSVVEILEGRWPTPGPAAAR